MIILINNSFPTQDVYILHIFLLCDSAIHQSTKFRSSITEIASSVQIPDASFGPDIGSNLPPPPPVPPAPASAPLNIGQTMMFLLGIGYQSRPYIYTRPLLTTPSDPRHPYASF